MTRPAEVQVARSDGWLSNDRIRLTGLLREGPAQAGPSPLRALGSARLIDSATTPPAPRAARSAR